jgi:phage shock protein A
MHPGWLRPTRGRRWKASPDACSAQRSPLVRLVVGNRPGEATNGRLDVESRDGDQGEVLEAARSGRGPGPLDYSYERQLQLLQNVKRGVADVVTAKKRLQLQADKLEQSLVKLDTQARQALAAGREDLARAALERKAAAQTQLQDLDVQLQALEQQQQKLVASERQLSAKVEAFRTQKETIKAQYSAAEAQVRIGEAATGIGEQMADTGLAIQRAKDKTEAMTARAGAIDELVESGALEDFTSDQTQLDRELAQISSQSQVDSELEKMKAELGAGETQKELES